jgi:hypothetical protein
MSPVSAGVVAQVRAALQPRARLATALGFLLGGFVPLATYVVAHQELDVQAPLYAQRAAVLVLGGLLFSATTVYQWSRVAFGAWAKALGFVVLLEGVMVTSSTPWLALTALAYLIAINGVATGCRLSRGAATEAPEAAQRRPGALVALDAKRRQRGA